MAFDLYWHHFFGLCQNKNKQTYKEHDMGGGFSIIHWIILLVVVVVMFGTAKLKNFGKDVGGAVRDFKNAVRDDEKEQRVQQNRVLDHEALDHKKNTPADQRVYQDEQQG